MTRGGSVLYNGQCKCFPEGVGGFDLGALPQAYIKLENEKEKNATNVALRLHVSRQIKIVSYLL